QVARRRSRRTLWSSFATPMGLVRSTPHHEDLTGVVYRVCFKKHYPESHRGRAVQICHAFLFCPYKGAISRRACRTSNHSTHVVDIKRTAGVSTGEYPEILHSSCLSPQKSAHPPWTFRVPDDVPVVVDCASLAQCIPR